MHLFISQLRHHLTCGSCLSVLVESDFGAHVSVLVDVFSLLSTHVLLLHRDDVLLTFDEKWVLAFKIKLEVPHLLQLICLKVGRILILELRKDLRLFGIEFFDFEKVLPQVFGHPGESFLVLVGLLDGGLLQKSVFELLVILGHCSVFLGDGLVPLVVHGQHYFVI